MTQNPVILFNRACLDCSKMITTSYSTSFSAAIRLLHPDLRSAIHAIYGFVRLTDEIVDSFHDQDKETLLYAFEEETFLAIDRGLSLNPVLNSFQLTVRQYNIDRDLIDAFFGSMKMDLRKSVYNCAAELDEYIYGSAEVVGLMCLYVFCEGNQEKFDQLTPAARALGAAFQKVNFLRDLKADYKTLGRSYFPGLNFDSFDNTTKSSIEASIESDFKVSSKGIFHLPAKARFGVYVAYKYYYSLFKKIKEMRPEHIMKQRVRISDYSKAMLLLTARLEHRLNRLR